MLPSTMNRRRASTRLGKIKRAILAAKSIGYSQGPSGVYMIKLFERWGIADTIKPRVVQTQPGNPVGEAVLCFFQGAVRCFVPASGT